MRRARKIALAALLATSAQSGAARAQTTDRDRALTHFEIARGHVQAGRCDLALEELRLSIDYEPTSVGARLNLGDCLVVLGRLPEAFRQFKDAETNAVLRNDPRVETARRSAAQVEAKLVRVVLREVEPSVAGVVLAVDGRSMGTRPWFVAVTPDAPHVLVASAPDGRRWRADVTGHAGETVRFEVVLEEQRTRATPTGSPSASGTTTSALVPVGVVVGSVGLAALVTGAVFGALASGARNDLAAASNKDPQCSGTYPAVVCDPAAQPRLKPLEDRAVARSTLSTVGFIAGGSLVAGGLLMVVLAPRGSASSSSSRPAVTAAFGAGEAGAWRASVEGSF